MDIKEKLLKESNVNHINLEDNKSVLDSNSNIDENKIHILSKQIIDLNTDLVNQKLLAKEKLKLYRNRSDKEIDNTYKFSLNKFINLLLPTIDNIERALNLFNKEEKIFHPIFDKLENVLQSFIKLLKKFGLEIINESNVPFNPDIHQAMVIKSSTNVKENYVISVMQKGYSLNGRLLRPAMVIVSKP
ncbi:MAG: nucleotide exchange factor GrpE [Buchnera aphidicola (Melaphis rhois)]